MSFKMLLLVALVIVTQLGQIHSLSIRTETTRDTYDALLSGEPKMRFNTSKLYIFGGKNGNNRFEDTAYRMNGTRGKWELINNMPVAVNQLCGAVAGNKIYLFGGFAGTPDKLIKLATANVYDCLADTYTQLRMMPQAREGCGAAALNGSIYVAGGSTSNSSIDSSIIRYDTRTNQWSTVSSMNTARRSLELVELGGLLYAIGGDSGRTTEVFNATTERWSSVANSHYYHTFHSATVYNGKIYVFSRNGFEAYSPDTNRWTTLNSLNDHPYEGRTLVIMNGKLWAMGGAYWTSKTTVAASNSMFSYDPSTDLWTKEHNMIVSRGLHTAFVVNHF